MSSLERPRMPDLPPEMRERVRGYLVSQAARLTLPELVEKLRADTAPLAQAATALPPERFAARPAPEEWSAAEVWAHILDMNESGATAIETVLDTGAAPARTPDDTARPVQLPASAAAAWAQYERRREALFDRVLRASGEEAPTVTLPHPLFGDLTWRQWLLFMRVHDLDHLAQLRAVAGEGAGGG